MSALAAREGQPARQRAAQIISDVLNPLTLVGVAAYVCLIWRSPQADVLGFCVLFVASLLPVTIYHMTRVKEGKASLHLEKRRERLKPLAILLVFSFLTVALMLQFHRQPSALRFATAQVIVVFLLLLITVFWKVSVHGAGAGALLAIAIALFSSRPGVFALFALGGGAVFWARLHVKAHTPLQVGLGAVLGYAVFAATLNLPLP